MSCKQSPWSRCKKGYRTLSSILWRMTTIMTERCINLFGSSTAVNTRATTCAWSCKIMWSMRSTTLYRSHQIHVKFITLSVRRLAAVATSLPVSKLWSGSKLSIILKFFCCSPTGDVSIAQQAAMPAVKISLNSIYCFVFQNNF